MVGFLLGLLLISSVGGSEGTLVGSIDKLGPLLGTVLGLALNDGVVDGNLLGCTFSDGFEEGNLLGTEDTEDEGAEGLGSRANGRSSRDR